MLYPEKMREGLRRAAMWAGIGLLGLVPRLLVMARAETRLDADESIVGLMALHAVREGKLTAFFWGQHYGGGHVIEAALASLLFRISGVSAAAVQIVPALFAAGLIVLVFAYAREIYGNRTAFWAAAVLSFSTPFLKSSLKADGYIETIFFMFLGLYLLHKFRGYVEKKRSVAALVLSGGMALSLGLAWWSYDFGLLAGVVAAAFIIRKRMIRGVGHFIVMLLCFCLGAAPIIIDNLFHDFANAGHLATGLRTDAPFLTHFIFSVERLFRIQLPAFFSRECVHVFVYPPPLESWVYAGLALAAVAVLLHQRARSRMPGVWALIPAAYLILYCATGVSGLILPEDPGNFKSVWTLGKSPRYLLPLEPYVSLWLALAIGILTQARRAVWRYAGALCAVALCAALAFGFAAILDDNTIYEGNVKTNPESVPRVVAFLRAKKIKCVHTTYFIKWRILFEGRESITAVDSLIMSGEKQGFDQYERAACPGKNPPAFVFHKDNPVRFAIYEQVQNGVFPYNSPEIILDHIVLYPRVHPQDADKTPEQEIMDQINKLRESP